MSEDNEKALANAEKIRAAIQKKLGDGFVTFVRLIENGPLRYVEMAARPVKGVPTDEVQAAYSAKYYEQMTDIPTMKERGRRILRDLQINLGLPVEGDG